MRKKPLNYRQGLLLAFCLAGFGIAIIIVTAVTLGSSKCVPMYIGYGLMVGSVVVKKMTWKCPYCRKAFPMRSIKLPSKCLYCKRNL